MIRMVLIGAAFLAVTITLILSQPPIPKLEAQSDAASLSVTRADTDLAPLAREPVDPGTPAFEAAGVSPDAPVPGNSDTSHDNELEAMIIEALRQGQSEKYIDALVNRAASTGKVEVPGSLVTPDGRVDTATLLTVLSKAPDVMRKGGQIYVVRPGDSLASISFRFYGTTDKAPEIFTANEALMGSPRNIAVGQELVIPAK